MADAAAAVRDEIQARLQTPQLVDAAADIAHYILRGAPERLQHSRGVAERAMFCGGRRSGTATGGGRVAARHRLRTRSQDDPASIRSTEHSIYQLDGIRSSGRQAH